MEGGEGGLGEGGRGRGEVSGVGGGTFIRQVGYRAILFDALPRRGRPSVKYAATSTRDQVG